MLDPEKFHDIKTHRSNWHDAINKCVEVEGTLALSHCCFDSGCNTEVECVHDTNAKYWQHELKAFNRLFDMLEAEMGNPGESVSQEVIVKLKVDSSEVKSDLKGIIDMVKFLKDVDAKNPPVTGIAARAVYYLKKAQLKNSELEKELKRERESTSGLAVRYGEETRKLEDEIKRLNNEMQPFKLRDQAERIVQLESEVERLKSLCEKLVGEDMVNDEM